MPKWIDSDQERFELHQGCGSRLKAVEKIVFEGLKKDRETYDNFLNGGANPWTTSKVASSIKLESMASHITRIQNMGAVTNMAEGAIKKFQKLLAKQLWNAGVVTGKLNVKTLTGIPVDWELENMQTDLSDLNANEVKTRAGSCTNVAIE